MAISKRTRPFLGTKTNTIWTKLGSAAVVFVALVALVASDVLVVLVVSFALAVLVALIVFVALAALVAEVIKSSYLTKTVFTYGEKEAPAFDVAGAFSLI